MMLQSLTPGDSLTPSQSNRQMFLLFDGACAKHSLRSWYEAGLDVCPMMVLKDGIYDGVSELGPMIADIRSSNALKELWKNNHPIVNRASLWHTSLGESDFIGFMRARVQVVMPDGRNVWLRLGDAKVVSRLATAGHRLPMRFWAHVDSIFFRAPDTSIIQYNPLPGQDEIGHSEDSFLSSKVTPNFNFSSDLISALESSTDTKHREVL